jgi:hypothetical protein
MSFYCRVLVCYGNVFTEPLPSNGYICHSIYIQCSWQSYTNNRAFRTIVRQRLHPILTIHNNQNTKSGTSLNSFCKVNARWPRVDCTPSASLSGSLQAFLFFRGHTDRRSPFQDGHLSSVEGGILYCFETLYVFHPPSLCLLLSWWPLRTNEEYGITSWTTGSSTRLPN